MDVQVYILITIYIYIYLDGSFVQPSKAGVIHNPTPITKNTLLKA